jgi:uroporphyrin-III C-methyltransferase
MGVGALAQICAGLVSHGLPADTPAALVEKATWPAQPRARGTLASLPATASAEGVRPPALLIVGEVVRLRGRLAWFGRDGMELAGHAARAEEIGA